MAPFNRSHTPYYWSAIVSIALSRTIVEFSSLRGRQPLDCLALRPPIGPNALPLINQLVIEIIVELFDVKYIVTLKSGLRVTQGL